MKNFERYILLGSLSANNEAVLHIDKPLSDYVNITKATELVLKLM